MSINFSNTSKIPHNYQFNYGCLTLKFYTEDNVAMSIMMFCWNIWYIYAIC